MSDARKGAWRLEGRAGDRRTRGRARSLALVATLLFHGEPSSVSAQPAPAVASLPHKAFPNGFPDDPTFFPIGVWLQSPSRGPAYKEIGINTFVGLWDGPTEEQLSELTKHGLFAIADQNDVALASPHRAIIRAWLHGDEPDNAQKNTLGWHVTCIPPGDVVGRTRAMKQRDPTRPIFLNFGRGVVDTAWHGRGTCAGDTGYYPHASQGVDIASFDIYPVANSDGRMKGRLEAVAQGVENLRQWAKGAQSVWAIIETAQIREGGGRPSPQQIRSEVWLALVAGANGIVYFVHEFTHRFREDGIFRHPDAVVAVKRVNDEILKLAPVLNSPVVPEGVDVSGPEPIGTLLRHHAGDIYLFTVSRSPRPSRARLRIPGLRDAPVEVIGEDRVVHVTDGILSDQYDGYEVHLYRIKGQ